MQRLVSRLRKALPEGLVEGQAGGYRLTVEPGAVGAVRFERLIGQASADENPRRVRLLRDAAVRELIAGHRLTTLTGPGGSGKTRLATETARTLLGDVADGVWLVDLATIGADGDVAQAALAGLGLRDALLGGTPDAELTGRLIAAIREREALLILNNCEHVIESAATFAHRVLGGVPAAADPGDEQVAARHHR